MLNLILLLIYVSTILAVIFLERKNPTEALLWVLVMVCMPFFGVLLYLIFGSTTAIKLTAALLSLIHISGSAADAHCCRLLL